MAGGRCADTKNTVESWTSPYITGELSENNWLDRWHELGVDDSVLQAD